MNEPDYSKIDPAQVERYKALVARIKAVIDGYEVPEDGKVALAELLIRDAIDNGTHGSPGERVAGIATMIGEMAIEYLDADDPWVARMCGDGSRGLRASDMSAINDDLSPMAEAGALLSTSSRIVKCIIAGDKDAARADSAAWRAADALAILRDRCGVVGPGVTEPTKRGAMLAT